jgi:pSer/pThr/pTyr-binding forkhead associated (FHA) protein
MLDLSHLPTVPAEPKRKTETLRPIQLDSDAVTDKVMLNLYIQNRTVPIPIEVNRGKTITIGRLDLDSGFHPELDLTPYQAEAFGVSRRHASFTISDQSLCLIDHNSTNATYLNGRPLRPNELVALKSGDEILFGGLKMTLEFQRN